MSLEVIIINQESVDKWKEFFRVIPINETVDKLKEYNIDLYDENGELKSMLSLLEELSNRWHDSK